MLELEKKYYVKPVGSNALTRAVLIFLTAYKKET